MAAVRPLRLVLEALGVGLIVAAAAAILVLQVWDQPFSVPFDYDYDASFYLMDLRGIEQHGTYLTNPNLGYPYGQELYDVPQGGDNLSFLALGLLARAGGPAVAMNAFIVATYALVAGVAYAVLRLLGLRRVIAGTAAAVYAFLPYHQFRRGGHLLLSNYAFIPLAVLFALAVLGDDPPFSTGPGAVPRLRFDRRALLVLAGCVVIGSTGAYYAAFAVLLLSTAGVVAALVRRSWRHLWSGVALASVVIIVFVVNLAPSIVYWIRHGTSGEVITRTPSETELYGLRIQQLFSPRLGHRNAALARLGGLFFQGPITSEPGQWLGVIAGVGVLLLLVVVVLFVVGGGAMARAQPWWERPSGQTLRQAGMFLLVSLLVATISGFAYFLSKAGLRDIRAWNRIVPVVGFLGLLAVAVVAEAWAARATERRGATWTGRVLVLGAVAALFVGWYDQTSAVDAVARAGVRPAWESDRQFFESMASDLPAGTPVFQFPVMGFPEVPPVGRTQVYDEVRGYLHAPSLRWSFGFVRGRHPAWPADLDQRTGAALVDYLREAGFKAVVVDRFGYADGGADLEGRLADVAPRRAESPDGRYAWYDLR